MASGSGSAAREERSTAQLTLGELAKRINAHLRRFEADPTINVTATYLSLRTGKQESAGRPYYHAMASYHRGAKLSVTYVSYQYTSKLSKTEAARYLDWLDAGNVGRHHEALSSANVGRSSSDFAIKGEAS